MMLQHRRVRPAAGQRIGQTRCGDTEVGGVVQCFGGDCGVAAYHHLVGDLGGLAGAACAHMGHALAVVCQQRAHALQHGGLTAGHHHQPTLRRADHAATDRCVQPMHGCHGLEPLSIGARGDRMDGGMIEQYRVGARAAGDAVAAEHHLFDGCGIGHAHHHAITCGGNGGG